MSRSHHYSAALEGRYTAAMRYLALTTLRWSTGILLLSAAATAHSQPATAMETIDACLEAVEDRAADADRTCSDQIARLRYDSASTANAPALAAALNNRAMARMNSGDLEGAAADLAEALTLQPGAWAPYLNRATLALMTGDPGAALNDLGQLREMLPGDSPAARAAARNATLAWRMLGNLPAAERQFSSENPIPVAPSPPPG